jgi:hypothetical protein
MNLDEPLGANELDKPASRAIRFVEAVMPPAGWWSHGNQFPEESHHVRPVNVVAFGGGPQKSRKNARFQRRLHVRRLSE